MRCMTFISSYLSSVASVYTFMKWEVWTSRCLRSPAALKCVKCYLNGLKWVMERVIKKPKIMVPAFKGFTTELGNIRTAFWGQESRGGNKILSICWYFQALEICSKLMVRGTYPWVDGPVLEEMEECPTGLASFIFCGIAIFSLEVSDVLFLKYHLILAFSWYTFSSVSTGCMQLEGWVSYV